MAGTPDAADKLYQRLMQIHEQAFEAGRFQVAYHVMAAAVHAAEEFNSVESLEQVEVLARSRQAELDEREPEHAISTASAKSRGNTALFANLATTAGAARVRISAEVTVGRMRSVGGGAD
jgi:hypothetical protein